MAARQCYSSKFWVRRQPYYQHELGASLAVAGLDHDACAWAFWEMNLSGHGVGILHLKALVATLCRPQLANAGRRVHIMYREDLQFSKYTS